MCTVSYIPVNGTVYLTSNRDEKSSRKKAIAPTLHRYNGCNLIYPRDAEMGGTWIAMKENGDAAVLLNGAFLCHESRPPYRQSRGIIFLDIMSTRSPSLTFSKTNLGGIEPFTLIIVENGSLFEFRWDGEEKYCRQLSRIRPHIWSSSTLYDGLVIKKREEWFARFLNRHPRPTQLDILNFHRHAGDGDSRNNLLMDREGIYSTVSITGILLTADRGSMKYHDLKSGMLLEKKIELYPSKQLL